MDNMLRAIAAGTVYPVVTRDGRYANNNTHVLETEDNAHWTHYALATSTSGVFTVATFPAWLSAGDITVFWVNQIGGSPVPPGTDDGDGYIANGQQTFYWDGTLLWDSVTSFLLGDKYIDITVSPWDLVVIQKGTGGLNQEGSVELLRQALKDVNGNPIGSTTTVIGQNVSGG